MPLLCFWRIRNNPFPLYNLYINSIFELLITLSARNEQTWAIWLHEIKQKWKCKTTILIRDDYVLYDFIFTFWNALARASNKWTEPILWGPPPPLFFSFPLSLSLSFSISCFNWHNYRDWHWTWFNYTAKKIQYDIKKTGNGAFVERWKISK